MNDSKIKNLSFLGRFFLTAIFIMSGMGKIFDFGGTVAYMESAGMSMAQPLLVGAIVLELVGGLSILLGFKARLGALALIVFLIPASLIFHAFWGVPEAEAKMQMIMFMKNLSIMGALIFLAVNGSGALSLDNRFVKQGGK